MKQHKLRASPALLGPRNRTRTALHVSCVNSVALLTGQETQTPVAHNVVQAFTQQVGGTPRAQAVLWGLTKTKLASLLALPASPGAIQIRVGELALVSSAGQEPTRQPMVPQPGAQTVTLGNIKAS